jgi:hypothetical protein
MKKLYTLLLFAFIVIAAITEQGCDILNNLFLDQPLKQTIVVKSGSGSDIKDIKTFSLSDYDAFDDNVESIESLTYVSAAYFTEDYSPGLTGTNIVVTLYAGDGTDGPLVWSVTIPFGQASDYVKKPYKIKLTPDEIAEFNKYLADYENNDTYTAELKVENVSGDSTPYSLTGRVEIIVQMEIKP